MDRNIGRLAEKVEEKEYSILITADHGNCEDMGTEDSPNTSHTTNPVPLIPVDLDQGLDFEKNEIWEIEGLISEILDL